MIQRRLRLSREFGAGNRTSLCVRELVGWGRCNSHLDGVGRSDGLLRELCRGTTSFRLRPWVGGAPRSRPFQPEDYLAERYPFELSATLAPGFQFLGWAGLGTDLPFYGVIINAPSAAFEVLQASYQPYINPLPPHSRTLPSRRSIPSRVAFQLTVDGVAVTTALNFTWTAGSTLSASRAATGNPTAGEHCTGPSGGKWVWICE